jgi:hypothetical protein
MTSAEGAFGGGANGRVARHGTQSGYVTHMSVAQQARIHGEPWEEACDACKAAHAAYENAQRARRRREAGMPRTATGARA